MRSQRRPCAASRDRGWRQSTHDSSFAMHDTETPMARITLRQLLDHAAERGYGVPAFNINNMEQVLAIMAAARKTDAPVILQASRGARSYTGDVMLRRMVEAAAETHPDIPICLHLDHGDQPA